MNSQSTTPTIRRCSLIKTLRGPKIVTPDVKWSEIRGRSRESTVLSELAEQKSCNIPSSTVICGIDGIVLRYGRFYGPGTWPDVAKGPCSVHVDAAAQVALLALKSGVPGIYNIAEDDGAVSSEKAKRDLGFDASFRMKA